MYVSSANEASRASFLETVSSLQLKVVNEAMSEELSDQRELRFQVDFRSKNVLMTVDRDE